MALQSTPPTHFPRSSYVRLFSCCDQAAVPAQETGGTSRNTHTSERERKGNSSDLGRLGRIVNACLQSLIQKGADPGPSISAWLLKRPNRQDSRIVHAQVPIKQTQSSSCGSSNVVHSLPASTQSATTAVSSESSSSLSSTWLCLLLPILL